MSSMQYIITRMRTRQKSKPEFIARQLAQESQEAESEKEITEKRKQSLDNFVFLKGQLLVAEEEIERLKQQIDSQEKQIKEIKIEKDEVMRVRGTEKNNLKEKLRVVESTSVRLTDNRPNSNIQTKIYHADQTIWNDQQWSDVVRSKSQREPEREHTRKRQREHQRGLERERGRKREHERQRLRQHQRKR